MKVDSAAIGQHLRGILVALVMVGAWVAIQAASGHLSFEGWMDLGPVGLAGFAAILIATYLGRAFQIGIEEALFRVWALQAIGVRYGAVAGILASEKRFLGAKPAKPTGPPVGAQRAFGAALLRDD